MIRLLATLLLPAAPQEKDPPSFGKDDRVVATYHYIIRDGHDPGRELEEMGKAGIDLAVTPSPPAAGLPALLKALEVLERERKDVPRIALGLSARELNEDGGLCRAEDRRRFAARISAFFASFPVRFRGRVDGRPILWLAPGAPAPGTYDRASFEALAREDWSAVGGRPPYVVADASWKDLPADRTYAFGAPARGMPVFSVSRGRDAAAYERAWYVALRSGASWVALETWNGPGSELGETPEHGRAFLDATRRYVRKFKLGETIPLPKGKYTGAPKVLFTTVFTPGEQGLRPVPNDDGVVDRVRLGAFTGLLSKENALGPRRHLYFDVDDSFCFFEKRSFAVTVEFLDAGEGSFWLEYDSGDAKLPAADRPLKRAGEVRFTGTGDWRMERFDLPDAVFANGQKGGADFRLGVERRGLTVRSVAVAPR